MELPPYISTFSKEKGRRENRASNLLLHQQLAHPERRVPRGLSPGRCSCPAVWGRGSASKQSSLPLQAANADHTTVPSPAPAWVAAKPHRNAAGHMRCGGGGRASPPAPQGDPAPSCPDAVTKVIGEIAPPRPR